jgi:hypothetical protein
MLVDVQQMSNLMLHLHTLWVVPLQIGVAIAILAKVVGKASLVGLFALSCTASIILIIAKLQKKYQECIMHGKNDHMKAFNEALTNIKVGEKPCFILFLGFFKNHSSKLTLLD